MSPKIDTTLLGLTEAQKKKIRNDRNYAKRRKSNAKIGRPKISEEEKQSRINMLAEVIERREKEGIVLRLTNKERYAQRILKEKEEIESSDRRWERVKKERGVGDLKLNTETLAPQKVINFLEKFMQPKKELDEFVRDGIDINRKITYETN